MTPDPPPTSTAARRVRLAVRPRHVPARWATAEVEAGRHLLATITFGEDGPPGDALAHLPLPALGPGPLVEQWIVDEAPGADEVEGFRLARTSRVLFGVAETDGKDLARDTRDLYRRLLSILDAEGMEPLRIWNSVPDLHPGRSRLDRYMQFCMGRARAFEEVHGPGFERRLPAGTAVGSRVGPQVVHFLATRRPGTPIENPRQVSAYRYPARYGPRSPAFARAARAPEDLGGHLLISGTASILGHESRHPGNVVAQTEESLRNLRALVHGAEAVERPLGARLRVPRVYLRDPADLERVRPILERELAPGTEVLYLHAEICRSELLVEIEGLGLRGEGC